MCFLLSSCELIDYTIDAVSSLINPKGIVEDVSLGYDEIEFGEFLYSPHYEALFSRECYKALENDEMRELYDMLYYNSYLVYPKSFSNDEYKCKQVILDDACLSEAQIRLVVKAIGDDNPHVYWLSTRFGFLVDEDKNYTAVQLYSRMSPEKLIESKRELKKVVDGFFSSLESGLSEYERELLVHDFVLECCEYDSSLTDAKTVPKGKEAAFDPYGTLVEGKAVCEGYARAFQLLCNGVGIECVNVIGKSQKELHMWNAVKLNGEYCYVDTTWDDRDDEAFMYDYFNLTEKQLRYDHEFSPICSEMSDEEICGDGEINAQTSNFFIPDCDTNEYNYYVKESVHLNDYEGEDVTQALKSAAINKEKYFHIYIDEKEFDFSNAVDRLFFSYPQYFFKYIEDVNYTLEDYSIDSSNLSLYEKKQISVVTVMLEYI